MNKQLTRINIILILIVALAALVTDTLTSIVGIQALIEPENLLGDIFVITSSFLINGMIYATPFIIFAKNRNILVVIVWILSAIIDAYTTLVAIIFEVLLRSDTVDWTQVNFNDSPNNYAKVIFVLITTSAISLMAASSSYWVQRFKDD